MNTTFPAGFLKTKWMENLSKDDLALLISYGEHIPANSSKPLILEGQIHSNLYLVMEGTLIVTRSGADGNHILGEIAPGESIGEMSIFDPSPASATVTPQGTAQLWRVDQKALRHFLDDNPVAATHFLEGIISVISKRIRTNNIYVIDLIDLILNDPKEA